MLFYLMCEWLPIAWLSLSSSMKWNLGDPPKFWVCENDTGEVLFLTPYLANNRLLEGREAAKVPPFFPGVESYSGFLTVNTTYESNMFFWFFPAENNSSEAPVVLWLQGGPGSTSLYSTFLSNGPFLFDKEQLEPSLKRNTYYWSQKLNVIYLDNPVGTGFSFTRSKKGLAITQEDLGRDLYSAVYQFFQLFPEYRKNDFFISGSSYAGKYVPTLAYTIHKKNPTVALKINLKGISIGNGWVDPLSMLDYAAFAYNIGLIDLETKEKFAKIEEGIKTLAIEKRYHEAQEKLDYYFYSDIYENSSLFTQVTGYSHSYNYLYNDDPEVGVLDGTYKLYVFAGSYKFRKSIHVGRTTFNMDSEEVYDHLIPDSFQSAVPLLEILLDHYQVLIYNGQFDIICAYQLTMNYVRNMKWKGVEEYRKATRKQWRVGRELAGYVKSGGNLTEILVRNAGHSVPADQPLWALDMITKFTNNIPINSTSETELENAIPDS